MRHHVGKGLRDILPFAGWTRSHICEQRGLWMMIVDDESGNEVASERATMRATRRSDRLSNQVIPGRLRPN